MIFDLMKLIKKSSLLSILYIIICEKIKRSCQEDLEVLEKLNHQAQVLVLSLESMENQLRSKLLMKKMKPAELEVLVSFKKQQKTKKLSVEEMKLEEELVKEKARVKVIEVQEELKKGKTLSSYLNSGNQIGFNENLSFRGRTANNMQSINQNMKVLELCYKNSTEVNSYEISETFGKASPSHSAVVHNLHNDNNRFIGARSTNNTSRIIKMGRLTRLLKFTGGETKELIKHCIHLPPETGYENAVRLPSNSHGNLHYLLASNRKEIKAFPSVKPGDTSPFRKFYSFVLKCDAFSKSTAWNALETPETHCILVSKLPGSLRDKWNRKVQVVRRSFRREPCLSDFASFVHEETILVNDPI